MNIPPALVLGCNTQHGINVLSDYIQEQTGYPPKFHESGWTTVYHYYDFIDYNTGFGEDYGNICGNGFGDNYGDGYGEDGDGDGYSYGDGFGDGFGLGYGLTNGNGDRGYGPLLK